jgi:uncharacterized repeat protein (TIGR01451 family)
MEKNLKKLFILALLVVCVKNTYAQLDSEHYLPPLKQVSNNAAIQQQAIYLSTPETTPFDVEIYRGTSATPLLTITNLAKGASKVFDSSNGLGNGDNNITLVTNGNTGIVLTNSGLRFVSPSGKKFYVNYRGRSSAQAGSLTSKGSKALGRDFRWGGIPNRANNGNLSTSLGMMATEDGTVVTVFGYDPDCEFRMGNTRGGITDDILTIDLEAGESFVIEAAKNETTANIDGWLGATITATKPIVISNGGLNVGVRSTSQARDVGIDQPVPTSVLGREYVFVRGNGSNETEFPIIVGTKNGTEVYADGTLVGTINDGDYLEVPGSFFSSGSAGANMYVTTTKDTYAFQCLAGTVGKIQTIGMNFIAPVNCLLPSLMDEIPDINQIAGSTTNVSAITIIASTLTQDSNIIVNQDGVQVTLPSPIIVSGTSDWKTFYVTGLSGEIDVSSTGPIAVGTFMSLGQNAGLAGYFSGFDTVPEVEVEVTGGGCFPASDLKESTGGFDAYQWFLDGNPIAGATGPVHTPLALGDYYALVTKGTCSYPSAVVSVYNCDPDIVLSKTADTNAIEDGDTVTFTVTVESSGINAVSNLVINDVLPVELELVSATPSFGTWTSPNWTIGDMNSGEVHTLDIVAKAKFKTSGTIINTISNTQDQVDSNTSTDDPTEQITITAKIADLRLKKTVQKGVVKVGETATYTLSIKNDGPRGATGVEVKDILPAGLTYDVGNSTIPANTTYNATTGIWDLSGLTIATGQTITIKIAATVTSTGVKLNSAQIVNTNQTDSDSIPNNGN